MASEHKAKEREHTDLVHHPEIIQIVSLCHEKLIGRLLEHFLILRDAGEEGVALSFFQVLIPEIFCFKEKEISAIWHKKKGSEEFNQNFWGAGGRAGTGMGAGVVGAGLAEVKEEIDSATDALTSMSLWRCWCEEVCVCVREGGGGTKKEERLLMTPEKKTESHAPPSQVVQSQWKRDLGEAPCTSCTMCGGLGQDQRQCLHPWGWLREEVGK